MKFEDMLAEIQSAVDAGQMSPKQGVAAAQAARQQYEQANQVPYAAYAGAGLGGAAGAALAKANPFLGGIAGSIGGGLAGGLIDGPEKLNNFDLEDALATAATGAAGYVAGKGGMGALAGKLGARAPQLARGMGDPRAMEAVGNLTGAAAGLGTQMLTNDPTNPNASLMGDVADVAATGASGAAGGLAGRALLKGAPGPVRAAGTGLAALLGGGVGDKISTNITGGDRTLSPEAMGTAAGALLGMGAGGRFGGPVGAATAGTLGGLAGGVAGHYGGDLATMGGTAAALASTHPAVRSALASAGAKAKGYADNVEWPDWMKRGGGKPGSAASQGPSLGLPGGGGGAKPGPKPGPYADPFKQPGKIAEAAKQVWAEAEKKNPEWFKALSPDELKMYKTKLASGDGETWDWFIGRFELG